MLSANLELKSFLEHEENNLNKRFPKHQQITMNLFHKVREFLDADFERFSDNRVYRYLLDTFRDIIYYAFDNGVSKSCLLAFFKILNKETVAKPLCYYAKSRAKDIEFILNRLLLFFTFTWQGVDNDRAKVLEEIVSFIDSCM